jgi:hypothetical protein
MPILPITNIQQKILHILYKFRFLDRVQIQTILQNKSTSNINEWLKDLVDKKYIDRKLFIDPKVRTVPAIYFFSSNGIKYLKKNTSYEKSYVRRLYGESKRSDQFIDLSRFIADMYITLFSNHRDNPDFSFYTQSDYSIDGIIKEIFPHFVFRREGNKGYYIAEIFREKLPRYAIHARIMKYVTYFKKHDQTNAPSTFLLICPNLEMKKYISKFTHKVLLDEDIDTLKFRITTYEDIINKGIEQDIWDEVTD